MSRVFLERLDATDVSTYVTRMQQMESVRKDIECCYGILKVRFKILACPIQYHSRIGKQVRVCLDFNLVFLLIIRMQEYISKINNTVWTCCILHNLLLGFDGKLIIHD
jgi:hypothetical protein